MDAHKLVVVARIRRAHGVRGGLAVASLSDVDLDRLLPKGEAVALSVAEPVAGQAMTHRVSSCRPLGGDWLVVFDGLDVREKAQTLAGRYLSILAEDLPELDDDEVYLHQLVGLTVRTKALLAGKLAPEHAQPDDPVVIGVLEDFLEVPAQQMWVIRAPGGEEILFPATEENVEAIDMEKGLVDIAPPPGLIDLAFPDPKPPPKPRARKANKERSVTE